MSFRWKERNAKFRKDWKCEEENPCQSEEEAWHRQLCLGLWQWMRRGGGSRKNFSKRERRAKGQVRLLRAHGLAELRKVVSGSAMQGLWLRDRKVGSQVGGKDRSRLPGRGTFREVKRGGRWERGASNRAKKSVYTFRVRFGRERRASRLSCLSFTLDRRGRREAEM